MRIPDVWTASLTWRLVSHHSRSFDLTETFYSQEDAQAFCFAYLDRVDEELENRVSALNEKQGQRDGRISTWGSDL